MINELEKGFFGFWVKQYKVSLLLTFLLIFYGAYSLYFIPKESAPDIKYGIVGITTIYTGVNPNDIDSLITDKIESEIENIDGVKEITSTSSLGVSSITVELETDADTRDLLTDIKDKVDEADLPEDAEDPIVVEISSDNEVLFSVYLGAKEDEMSFGDLYDKAVDVQNYLEGTSFISEVDVSPDPDYEVLVSIDKNKLENYGLTLGQISSIISSYNKNTPIGNYKIGDMSYDFRFDGEYTNYEDLLEIPLIGGNGKNITLGDIAKISKDYVSKDIISKLGYKGKTGYNYIKLTLNKTSSVSIFSGANQAKETIKDIIENDPNFSGLEYSYTEDLSDDIINDYKTLAKNGLTTLALVFTMLFIFLGFKEAVISTLLVPLAFFITFIVLNGMGFSLNMLTNFSLLLSLGIALDTIIVIIEGASEKLKRGFKPKTAVLLTVKEFKTALISGTSTTLVVFLPMMLLPGVMGKYLAYIPITVFITLLAGLFLSLTLNSPIFMILNKDKKYYIHSGVSDNVKSREEVELLAQERQGKIEKSASTGGIRYKIFGGLEDLYYNILSKNISKNWFRKFIIFTPFILLILTFVTISPKLGFNMFPSGDNPSITLTLKSQDGRTSESMKEYIPKLNEELSSLEEMKVYSISIDGEKITVGIQLLSTDDREKLGLRNSFEVEKQINSDLAYLKSYGLKIETEVAANGPPTGSPVGIKLLAKTNNDFDTLVEVSKDFENYLKTVDGTKNVGTSSSSTPGQFIFKLNNNKLSSLGLTPSDVLSEVYFLSSGLGAGSIKGVYEDHDITLRVDDFDDDELSPQDIMEMSIPTSAGNIKIGNIATYEFMPAISNIQRDDGKVTISVNSDIEEGLNATDIQPILLDFAESYDFPESISYTSGGETSENADLIASTISSFIISIFLIFTILVLQFNSFLQPAIVLYSIVLALLGVNIGLFLTGNPYSMPFAIGFIALTGIVVNNAIILIDKINSNLDKGVEPIEAVAESGKSRLRPILLTTFTTLFGILPLALEDEFWAGLGFTIIFGLMFSSFMTLFVTPSLYYSLFLAPKKRFFITRIIIWIYKLLRNILLLIVK